MEDPIQYARIWLPEQVRASCEGDSLSVLIGWTNASEKSVDLVVAAAFPVSQLQRLVVRQLQNTLDVVETKLPEVLRSERKLRVIGQYSVSPFYDGSECAGASDRCCERREPTSLQSWEQRCFSNDMPEIFEGITNVWAAVSACKSSCRRSELDWAPCVRALYLDSVRASINQQIIVYKRPVFGSHHFSCLPWASSHDTRLHKSSSQANETSVTRRPWLAESGPQQRAPDMVNIDEEAIMMQLNCATFVDESLKNTCRPGRYPQNQSMFPSIYRDFLSFPVAAVVAIWATVLYAFARVLNHLRIVWLPAIPFLAGVLQKSMACRIVNIRCQQLMAWPFILLWGGLGPEQPNVAAAHDTSVMKSSTWSALLFDKIVGTIAGFFLLKHHASIMQLAVWAGQTLTNDVLRVGCVWLMGVPAGFKLNNELTAAIGTISLHVIQSWSTLLNSLIAVIEIFLQISGVCSLFLGFTIQAAVISDLIFLSALHVSCLHHAVAVIHSHQLQALSALWRLFRGRKRNPLRRRIDTFDYSVEQLVVGSLMFTPLLLLLPTTSVYHTFFSLIFLTLSGAQFILHFVIDLLHHFPFSLVATWMTSPGKFPSGVWFQCPEQSRIGSQDLCFLRSNLGNRTASFGEILRPSLTNLWLKPEWSSAASFIYKVVSGERYDLKLQIGSTASFPHTRVNFKCYAWLCFTAISKPRVASIASDIL